MRPLPGALSLRANFSWTLAGNLVFALCQWGMLAAIARMGSPEQVGDLAFALAVTAPVFLLTNLNLRAAQATDHRGDHSFAEYAVVRAAGIGLACAVIGFATIAFDLSRTTVIVLVGLTAARVFDAVSDLIYGLLQRHERMDRIAISRILQGGLQLATLGVGFALTGSLPIAVFAMALASASTTLLYDLPSAGSVLRRSRIASAAAPRFDQPPSVAARRLATLVLATAPLGMAGVLDSLNATLPRLFLDRYAGRAELGIFAALASLLVAEGTVVGALADAARPRLAVLALADGPGFRRLLWRLLGIGSLIGLGGLVVALAWGASILNLLFGPVYAAHAATLAIVMLAGALWVQAGFLGTAISAFREFRRFAFTFLGMAVTTTVAAAILVPLHGIHGAAWSLCAGQVVRCGLSTWLLAGLLGRAGMGGADRPC